MSKKPRNRVGHTLAGSIAAVVLAGATGGAAAAPADPASQVHAWRAAHEKDILEEFTRFLALPNVATVQPDIEANATALSAMLEHRGFTTRLLSAAPGTPPAVFGELDAPGARRTVVFYAHYDGQPVAQPEWRTRPFTPVVRAGSDAASSSDIDWRAAPRLDPQWRVYGRSASDDKAPIQAMLSALDALKAAGKRPTINVKVFYEGEEEQGSGHLDAILKANRALLSGDLFILSDGPRHPSGRMEVYFGARGTSSVDLTVYGPARPLHDGHYGNWAPNPAIGLTHLIDSMRDEDGRILVPGFYDDVRALTPAETAALAALPDVETGLKRELALGRTEGGGARLANTLAQPALNLRGLSVGGVGDKASNVISTEARASIDFRLVPDETPEKVRDRIEAFLRDKGWWIVHEAPTPQVRAAHPRVVRLDWDLDYPAYRANPETPQARAVIASIETTLGAPVLQFPMLGGSVPMSTFAADLGMPIIGVPLANADNNQHAANENLRLQNLWDGIDIYAGLLAGLSW